MTTKLHKSCPANPRLFDAPPDLSSIPVVAGDLKGKKAEVDLETKVVTIDPTYARHLDDDSAAAVLFHEAAHLQRSSNAHTIPGTDKGCERCADNRLGASLALSGWDRKRAKRALDGMNVSRNTMLADSLAGFDAVKGQKVAVPTTPTTSRDRTSPPSQSVRAPTAPPPAQKEPGDPVVLKPITDPHVAPDPAPPTPEPTPSTPPATTISAPETAPSCGCAGQYDFGWVVGVAGGLSALSIMITQWAVLSRTKAA